MLLITCPFCGPRAESEFSYGGQAHIARPLKPETLSDEEWAGYVFWRQPTKGVFYERWMHAQGCRRWFNAVRDTVTYDILATYEAGTKPPPVQEKKYV